MKAEVKKTGLQEIFQRALKPLRYFHMKDVLIGGEFLLLIALYAIFMFTDKVPLDGLIVLGLMWFVRWWVTGRLRVATLLDAPILGILGLLPVSLSISVDWNLSLPKVYGIILGVAIFYAIVNAFDTLRRLELAPVILIFLSLAVTAVGLVSTDWVHDKIISLSQVYARIPRLIQNIPRSSGIHPNIFGGALTFLIPLLASLLWEKRAPKAKIFAANPRKTVNLRIGYTIILFLSFVSASVALILTQSRGSIMGVSVGLFALALWHERRFLWIIPFAAIGFLGAVQIIGGGNLTEFLFRVDVAGSSTIPVRMEIWQRAINLIKDFPFTGIGLGTFHPVAHALYPFVLYYGYLTPHAHNNLLAVAVDLGIPGLICYVALLSGFVICTWRASQVYKGSLRALSIGMVCGMLAHQVFGIMDAYMLGTKFGAIMWVFYGFASALYLGRDQLKMQADGYVNNLVAENSGVSSTERGFKVNLAKLFKHLRRFLLVYTYWIIFSLVAIALVVQQPFLGLIVAVVEGAILGYICVATFESKTVSPRTEQKHE